MKKAVLKALAAIVVLAALILGPGLLDLLRLQQYLTASTQAYEANGGPWPQVSDACIGCHGVDGNSVNPHYPSLAGQRPDYLAAQLRRFASGERVHPVMNAMARALNDREIEWLSAHFARQRPAENPHYAADGALREQGRQLVASGACAACHGQTLMGREQFPRLAGLGDDYLLRQLDGYAGGQRRDPTQAMNALAAGWSPQQRRAIATFLAAQPPAPDDRP